MKNKFNVIKWLVTAIICTFISSAYGQVTIYSQDFSGTYPWGMTTNNLNGTSYVWESGNAVGASTEPIGSTGDYATANSDNTCADEWDAELVTPALDFSLYQSVELNFGSYFEGYFGFSSINVDVSIDNGATWTTLHSEDSYEDQVTTIDLTAYAGYSNVKIRWRYQDPYGCVYWWSIDDIEITGILPPPCVAPPTAGAAVSNAPQVCSQVMLGLSGNTIGQGITYQWQSSPDGFVWTDISGATSPSTIQPISATTHFRAIVTCSGQSDTSTSVSVDVASFTTCYCMPTYVYSCTDDYTANVKFGTINNSSSCGGSTPNNYSDYTSLSTPVIKGNVYPLSVTTDGDDDGVAVWIDYDHSGTFDASELVLNGYAGTTPATYTANVTIPTSALSGTTIMRVRNRYNGTINANESCTTFNYGETEHYSIEIIAPAADEVGVTAITRPGLSACSLGNQLWVQLQNLGTNNLTSATVEVRVNGLSINTVTWNGSVAAGTSSEVQIPVTYAFADADSVTVLVSNPNGQTENPIFTFNNQIGRRLYAGLSGNKTVYGAGADFANINDALAALVLRGACDTVHFKIASNTYTTSHSFGPYLNAGPGKLAVFESATGNPADVVFDVPTAAGSNYVFSFNNASYYALRNITAKASGTTYAGVIDFRGDVDHIELGGNIFQSDTTAAYSTSNYNKTLAITNYNNGNDYDDIWIHNNTFIGGVRSIDFELAYTQFSNLVIEKNIFRSYSLLGVLTLNTSNVQINGNTFLSRAGITGTQSAAQIVYSYGGGSVSGNKVTMPAAGYGLLFSDVPGSGNRMLVSNNFVYSGDTTASATSNGIYVEEYDYTTGNVVIANNSLSFRSKRSSNAAININSGNEIYIVNNNIGSFNTSPAVLLGSANQVSQVSNNNIFGSTLASVGGSTYTTLSALQGAGYGAGSVSVNPGFNGTDLHTCVAELNGAALSFPFIITDVDGDARSTTPDIGADEFVGDANNLLLQDHFLKCPNAQVTIGNAPVSGVTYTWTPSGNASQISTTTAGTYIVTATSSCGSYRDTAVVENKPLPVASFTSTNVGLAGIFTNTSTNATGYSWDFGDSHTSTDMSPTHVYSTGGTYTVTLTVTNECGSHSVTQPITVVSSGINENKLTNMTLFPNPTEGNATLQFDGLNANAVMTVFDITGKVMLTKNVAAGINQITFDASGFAPGVYSVKLDNGKNVSVLRFVKQ